MCYYPNLAVLATYSRDVRGPAGGNGIAQHLTWSEITDDELVENLGGRERTRQEVLFEMVCSEERYVQDLIVRLIFGPNRSSPAKNKISLNSEHPPRTLMSFPLCLNI